MEKGKAVVGMQEIFQYNKENQGNSKENRVPGLQAQAPSSSDDNMGETVARIGDCHRTTSVNLMCRKG